MPWLSGGDGGPVEGPPSGSKKDLVVESLRELCFREQSGHWCGCESLHSAIYYELVMEYQTSD